MRHGSSSVLLSLQNISEDLDDYRFISNWFCMPHLAKAKLKGRNQLLDSCSDTSSARTLNQKHLKRQSICELSIGIA
jgi:hypothetical protein